MLTELLDRLREVDPETHTTIEELFQYMFTTDEVETWIIQGMTQQAIEKRIASNAPVMSNTWGYRVESLSIGKWALVWSCKNRAETKADTVAEALLASYVKVLEADNEQDNA